MAVKKWLDVECTDAPVSHVARLAISQRMEAVLHYFPLAATKWEEDVEYVHQVRVWTRRAASAVCAFHKTAPKKRRGKLNNTLRAIRQAAGEPRDLDVLRERLEQHNDAKALKQVIAKIKQQRGDAQKELEKLHRKCVRKPLTKRVRRVITHIRWRGDGEEPLFHAHAVIALRRLLSQFFKAGETASQSVAEMHEMRIRGKKVRYAMELFASAFAPQFRGELYPVFSEVQEKLGAMNDHAAASELFLQWADGAPNKSGRKLLQSLAAEEEEQMQKASNLFFEWWSEDRSQELATRFESFFASGAFRDSAPGRNNGEANHTPKRATINKLKIRGAP